MTGVIDRPDVDFDAIAHAYKIEGDDVLGVSTVAKIGGAEETWGIASSWGFRIGYEGAHALATEHGALQPFDVTIETKEGPKLLTVKSQDDLREALKGAGLTPWTKRDKAAERGSWVHDMLEELAQDGDVPNMEAFAEKHGEEAAGHARSVLRWYLHYRPSFVATEVQVASRKHRFAGRYDLRAYIDAWRLLPLLDPLRRDAQAERIRWLAERGLKALGLLDLKTSKSVFPTTHFPQLEGYEGSGVEMGFPATDFRAVINTDADGSFREEETRNEYGDRVFPSMVVSWSNYDDFVGYLGALRAIRRIQAEDPETIREKAQEDVLLAQLPARSSQIAKLALPELEGMTSRAIGGRLGRLAKRGRCVKGDKGLWEPAPTPDDEKAAATQATASDPAGQGV